MRRVPLLKVFLLVMALLVAVLPPALAADDNGRPDGSQPDPGSIDESFDFQLTDPDTLEPGADFDEPLPEDIYHGDDVIIDGSLCVGFDCVVNMGFGFSTIVVQENNVRLRFTDTSNSASFPTRDWQLEANDSSNGGNSFFGIRDCGDDGACGQGLVFAVEAGAGNNAMYIDDYGRVGIGTNTPATEIDVADSDTPTLRLQQDGSGGWTPQTWDVAGNETNFFIRDATNGSKLPFRIRPNAPTNSIMIENNTGDVGIGTAAPEAPIHIVRTDGTASFLVDENSATTATRTLFELSNNGSIHFEMVNEDSGQRWMLRNANDHFWVRDATHNTNPFKIESGAPTASFHMDHLGRVGIGDNNPSEALDVVGNIIATGSITPSSDVNLKTAFEQVDALRVLEGLVSLDIESWQYRADPVAVRHLGPMAQEFAAAFGLGATDTGIATVDADGIAFVSIQALYHLYQDQQAEIDCLTTEVDDLEDRLAYLENLVAGLTN